MHFLLPQGSLFSFSSLLILWGCEEYRVDTASASWELKDLGLWWLSYWKTGSGKEAL